MQDVFPDEAIEGKPPDELPVGETEAAHIRDGLEGQAVCPFCGVVSDGGQPICPKCTMENSAIARKATKLRIGPWYVLQNRNPAAPGMKWDTLLSFVRKGRVKPQTIVRGPSTHQLWRFAAHVKGLSREFGVCYSCGGSVERAVNLCPHCNRLQEPPAYPDALLEGIEPEARLPIFKEINSRNIEEAAPAPIAPSIAEADLTAQRKLREKEEALAREQRETIEREREALQGEKEAAARQRDLVQREQEAIARERQAMLREKESLEKDRGVLARERDLLRRDREAATDAAHEAAAAREAAIRETTILRETAQRESTAAREAREAAVRESAAAREARESAVRESAAAGDAREAAIAKEAALARELAAIRDAAARETAAARAAAAARGRAAAAPPNPEPKVEAIAPAPAPAAIAAAAPSTAERAVAAATSDDSSVWDMGEMNVAKPFRPSLGSQPPVQITGATPPGQKSRARDGFLSPKDLAAAFKLNLASQEEYDIAAKHSEAIAQPDPVTPANLFSLGEPPAPRRGGGKKVFILGFVLIIGTIVALVASAALRDKASQIWAELTDQPPKPPVAGPGNGAPNGALTELPDYPPGDHPDNAAPPIIPATATPTAPSSAVASTPADGSHGLNSAAPPDVSNATSVNPPVAGPTETPEAPAPPSAEVIDQARQMFAKARAAEVRLDYPEAVRQLEQLKKLPRAAWPGDVEFQLEMDRKLQEPAASSPK